MTLKETSDPGDDYDLLCSWHTARLRMFSNKAFTPAALIDADREELERLVQQSLDEGSGSQASSSANAAPAKPAKPGSRPLSRNTGFILQRPLLIILLPVTCLAIAVFAPDAPRMVALGAIGLLFVFFALVIYEQTKYHDGLVNYARSLAEHLNLVAGGGKGKIKDPSEEMTGLLDSMEVAVTEGRMRERAITENSTDIICALTADFDIMAVNPAVETVWGYSPQELMGKSLLPFFLDSQDVLKMFERFRKNRQAGIVEVRVKKEDGTTGDALCVVQWSEGAQRFFCVAKDTTGQKEVERLRRQLVDMVSHDLRTPLQSILVSLTLLSSKAFGDLSEDAMKEINVAESSATHLICLINDLLDIEKWEAGKVNLDCGLIELMPVFERTNDLVSRVAQQQNITVDIGQTDLKIYADADRLAQVLVNLISNAIKFSPPKSVVQLTGKAIGDCVEIRVIDQGRGIPPEHLEAVFERFHQVETTDGEIQRGMGLGLAICKRIVESLGGSIGVESIEGEGSQFWVRVPAEAPAPTVLE